MVRFVGGFIKTVSWPIRLIQTGYVQNYALVMILGVLIFIGYVLWGTSRNESSCFRQHILTHCGLLAAGQDDRSLFP